MRTAKLIGQEHKTNYGYDAEVASDITEIAYWNTTANSEYGAIKRDVRQELLNDGVPEIVV